MAARRRLGVVRVVVGERAVVVRHCQLPARACLVRPASLPRVLPSIDGANLRRRAWQVRTAVWWHLELVVHEHRHVEGVDRAVSGDLVVATRGTAKVTDARSVEPIAQVGRAAERLGAGDVEALVEEAVAHLARVGIVAVRLGDVLNEPQRGDDLHLEVSVRPLDQVAVCVQHEEVERAGEWRGRRRRGGNDHHRRHLRCLLCPPHRRRARRRRRRCRPRHLRRLPLEAEIVLGDWPLVDLRAGQTSALVVHVGDHELKTRPDLDEEARSIRVSLGRWRALPVHVANILVPAPVGVQHDTIGRGKDLDVPACVSRRWW
eukprot:scaffold13003_cov70-Phaeocystis_antarctica.AAC.2